MAHSHQPPQSTHLLTTITFAIKSKLLPAKTPWMKSTIGPKSIGLHLKRRGYKARKIIYRLTAFLTPIATSFVILTSPKVLVDVSFEMPLVPFIITNFLKKREAESVFYNQSILTKSRLSFGKADLRPDLSRGPAFHPRLASISLHPRGLFGRL